MRWSEMNSRQINAYERNVICVLPIGAIEQHGPHLPVATDTLIAEAIGSELDAACDGALLVMPTINLTLSQHHLAFAGTLTVDHETFRATLMQVLGSASTHGFRRFFVLNAHGGNIAQGAATIEALATTLPLCEIVFATWFRAAANELRPLVEGEYPAVGHACEFETSLIMAIRPDLVDRAAIADDGIAPASPLLRGDMLSGARVAHSLSFDRITNTGVWGRPTFASADKGRKILNATIPVLKELLVAQWPDAPGIDPVASKKGKRTHESVAVADLARRNTL
jgi:creatinine amidohydrolase